MAASKASNERARRPRLPLSEKRRIVELTLHEGARIRAIAREHGVSRNSLRQWQALYRAGKLTVQPDVRLRTGTSSATFLPVTLAPAAPRPRSARVLLPDTSGAVVQLTLPSGAMLQIQTAALDADFICALVAQLRL